MSPPSNGPAQPPIKILHVLPSMQRRGIQTWLMTLLQGMDRRRFQMDIFVFRPRQEMLETEAAKLGAKLFHFTSFYGLPNGAEFKRVLLENGPYDVIHCHVAWCCFSLKWGLDLKVPVRIFHRRTSNELWVWGKMVQAGLLPLGHKMIKRYSTHLLAVSESTALSREWTRIYSGIDLNPFSATGAYRMRIRNEFGISESAFVLGHVGRYVKPKNHFFILEIFSEMKKLEPNSHLLLAGDGPSRYEFQRKVAHLGLQNSVSCVGERADIAHLLGSMDVFILPSLWEGLPLAVLEAQAAGLPMVIADTITEEVDIVSPLIHRLSIEQPAINWAKLALGITRSVKISREDALEKMEHSPFNFEATKVRFENFYQTSLYEKRAF